MIWRLVFRVDAPLYAQRFGSGIGELGGAATRLKAAVSRQSLGFDILYTQYDDLLISQRAAQALTEAGLSGLACDDRVTLYHGKVEASEHFQMLCPRGFAGLVHPSSGVRITRFTKNQFTFALPGNPRWSSDPRWYEQAGDVLTIWPFYNEVFVSDRCREVVLAHRLTGFEFMPFHAAEPKEGSGWRSSLHRRMTLEAPPDWLEDWQRAALWRQMQACASPETLPTEPPSSWGLNSNRKQASPAAVPPVENDAAAARWQRRELVGPLEQNITVQALDYLRSELATPDAEEWTQQSLKWDGDAVAGERMFRRWRLEDHATPIWVVYEVVGDNAGFSLLEDVTDPPLT